MLYVFGFDRLAVVAADLYFQHPDPPAGQEGPEHGVRLELRRITADALRGSIYSARPISVDEPVWRADLLETVGGRPGSFDRTHHHPGFSGWNESERLFEDDLSGDPVGWLDRELADLPRLLRRAGVDTDTASVEDVAGLRLARPEIVDAVRRLLTRVRSGELGRGPAVPTAGAVRLSWL